MANERIRQKARLTNVPHWKIAEKMGICDTTFCKRMRKEMPNEEQERILLLIDELVLEG